MKCKTIINTIYGWTGIELIKIAERLGCVNLRHEGGSHYIYTHPIYGGRYIIPHNNSQCDSVIRIAKDLKKLEEKINKPN